jgi:hypothetical protein
MLQYRNNREIFNNPIHLSKEEATEPLSVVAQFFDDYSLSEIRAFTQEMDFVCLTSDTHPFDSGSERDRLLDFRQNELRLLEAAYLLSRLDASTLEAAQQLLAKKANGEPIEVADLSYKIALLKLKIHELHDCIH